MQHLGEGGGGARMYHGRLGKRKFNERKEKCKIIVSVVKGEHRFQKTDTQYPTQPYLIIFKYMTFFVGYTIRMKCIHFAKAKSEALVRSFEKMSF